MLKTTYFTILLLSSLSVYADIYRANITVDEKTQQGENWDTWVPKAYQAPDIQLFVEKINFGICKNTLTCSIEFQTNSKEILVELIDDDTGLSSEDDPISRGKCHVSKECVLPKAKIVFEHISANKNPDYGNCPKENADVFSKKISIAITNSAGGGHIIEDIVVGCTYTSDIGYYNIRLYTSFKNSTNDFCRVNGEVIIKEDGKDVNYRTTETNPAFDNMLKTQKVKNFSEMVIKALLQNL